MVLVDTQVGSLSLSERLLVPPLLTGIFALLSFGWMFAVQGATRRVKFIALCSILFVLGTNYAMLWHEQLTALTKWKDAWVGASCLIAGGCIVLFRVLIGGAAKQRQ